MRIHRSRWFQRVLISLLWGSDISVNWLAVDSVALPGAPSQGTISWAFNTALLKFLYGESDEEEKALEKIKEIIDFFSNYDFLVD